MEHIGSSREGPGHLGAPICSTAQTPRQRMRRTLSNKVIKERCSQENRSSYRKQFHLERICPGSPSREEPRGHRWEAVSFSVHRSLSWLLLPVFLLPPWLSQFDPSNSGPLFPRDPHLCRDKGLRPGEKVRKMNLRSFLDMLEIIEIPTSGSTHSCLMESDTEEELYKYWRNGESRRSCHLNHTFETPEK